MSTSALLRRLARQALAIPFTALLVSSLVACTKQDAIPEPVRAVRSLIVGSATSSGGLEFAGEVRARIESRLGFQVGGKLVKRLVELGQPVRGGQALAQIDPRDLRLEQGAARAAVLAAQTQFDQAARDLQRQRDLRAEGFISAAQLERQESAWKAAQAALQQAQAQAGVQGNQAGYAVLTADAAGVITSVDAEVGQVVSPGLPVLTLAHDGPRDVVFSVPEDRLPWVKSLLHKPGAVKVRRWGNQTVLPATVRELSAAADPVTRTFLVKADLGQADISLGQTATVLLDTNDPDLQAVRLPLSALVGRGKDSFVWLLDPQSMTVKKVPVSVSAVQGDGVVIGSGLRRGQEIVTAGVHVLQPGQKVRRWIASADASADLAASAPAAGSAR